jgi:hypothetical protein
MDTHETGTPSESVPAPRQSHRSAVWFMVAFCVGLMLLVALNMK